MKTLRKSKTNKSIFGVCGGIGEYFGIDPTVIRIIWLISVLGFGAGLLLYFICALVIPD